MRPRAAFAHERGGEAGAVPGALQVDGDHLVEFVFGHLAHGGVAGDARVVHRDIDGAEFLDRGGQQRLDVFGAGDIAAHRTGDRRAESFPGIAGFEVADHHAGAVPYEGFGDGVADALGAAGDHGDPVREK